MIDVSRLSGPCPRCPGRRVVAVDIPRDRWACAASDRPGPFSQDQLHEHDATASADDPASAIELMRAAQTQVQVTPMNTTTRLVSTQHLRGAVHGR